MDAKSGSHPPAQHNIMPPEDILADVKPEEKIEVKDEEETETPPESPTEEKTEKEPSSSPDGKPEDKPKDKVETPENLPFHKHPRWKELQEELRTKDDRIGELEKKFEEVSPRLKEIEEKEQPIPSWFAESFGDNKELWGKYQSYDQERREEIKQEIYADQAKAQKEQTESVQKWNNWVEDQVSELAGEGLTFDRNELLNTMMEYKPTDEAGNLDFHKGYEILTKVKAAEVAEKSVKTDAKKKVASQTMEEGRGEGKPKDYMTPKDLRGKDWTDVAF